MAAPVTTKQEWDKVRKAFATSIMVDTSLFSLAQNLDGAEWPIKSKDDTPAKYIDLDLMEAVEMLAIKGLEPSTIDQLAAIMRDTLAFDQPFGDMVTQVEASSAKDNTLLKNLGRLGVPESYPIEFISLDPDTREFCHLEKLNTLGEFAVFAQNMSTNVIVGGDFRSLLNALAQSDEAALARFIPMRPGFKGLFLAEAIAIGLKRLPLPLRLSLAERAGFSLSHEQMLEARKAQRPDINAAESDLRMRCSRLIAELFADQLTALQTEVAKGASIERLLTPLGDHMLERIIGAQLKPYLQSKPAAAQADTAPKRGFWARLFGKG